MVLLDPHDRDLELAPIQTSPSCHSCPSHLNDRTPTPAIRTTLSAKDRDQRQEVGQGGGTAARFLTLEQVAEDLHISTSQTYALIRRGDLRAAKISGRGDWRIGRDDLKALIQRAYKETRGGSRNTRSAKTTWMTIGC
jgi:excisionase family DNA binding protein